MAKTDCTKSVSAKPVFEMDVHSNIDTDFCVNYEMLPESCVSFNSKEVNAQRDSYQAIKNEMKVIEKEHERLTNHADGLDYEIAVACGLLCGAIDVFFVGELDMKEAHQWGGEKINKFVMSVAKHVNGKSGKPYTGNDIQGAVRHLEKNFCIPSDSVTSQLGGGRQHHLRDFAHHPNIVGLAFSMLTQFTAKAYGTDTDGNFIIVETANKTFIGNTLCEKLFFGIIYWFFHMVSDIAGSNSYAGGGTGLPGPILSFAKLLSASPIFKDKNGVNTLSLLVSKAFNGTLTAQRDGNGNLIKSQMDLRTELGIIKQQAFPVILNEILVRGFYFISRIRRELKEKNIYNSSELNQLDWEKCIPFKNRTIVRMLTIACSTFTAVDIADATIRATAKSGGNAVAFAGQMLLRVNFVGVGKTVMTIGTDLAMEWQRGEIQKELNSVIAKELHSYTDLLRAEEIELEKIVCWGIDIKINDINDITYAIEKNNAVAIDSLTNQYLEKHHLDTQFGNFEEFEQFMMDSNDDLIL